MPKKSSKPKRKVKRQEPQKPAYYKYKPLQTAQSVRLLQLKPGKEDEPIRCWLFEARLDDWPLYQALSYTWGDPDDKTTIACNERHVSVPRNLAEALRILRRPDRLRILWADAVCINQKDPKERGSQVQLMSRIFSEASRVLIWFGNGRSSMIRSAFDYICGALNAQEGDSFASYQWDGKEISKFDVNHGPFRVPPDESTHAALEHLFTRPYFRRGWIIQEIVLPKSAQIFWKRACMNYLWLEGAARCLSIFQYTRFTQPARYGLKAVHQIQRFRYRLHDTPGQYSFADLLAHSDTQVFSDPRDYIYGLLGLQKICRDMAFKSPLFQPDYTISHIECYKSAVEVLLLECEEIGILSLVLHEEPIADDIPSWVVCPDYTLLPAIRHFYYLWRASGCYRAVISKQKHGDRDCMRLRGFRVATVTTSMAKGERNPEDVQTLIRDLQNRYDERSIAWTMTCGENIYRQSLWQLPEDEEQHLEYYREYIRHDVADAFEMGDAFGKRCVESVRCQALFETDKKLLGLCLGPAQPGDQVVIFYGGHMPFVLRPVQDSAACWKLVGVCFVHGIMAGEALRGSTRGGRRVDEDFDLI